MTMNRRHVARASHRKIELDRAPVARMCGSPTCSRCLHAAAPEPKRLVVIPGADHNDATLLSGPVVIEAIAGLLHALP